MKKFGRILGEICLALLVTVVSISAIRSQANGTTYHVDSIDGDDSNNGKSPSSAWQSLDKVNSMVFKPGDSILFKAGCSWVGQLKPKGSGNSSKQITIDMYGYDAKPSFWTVGRNKPHIDGNGVYATVLLTGVEYWTVSNLDVSNTSSLTDYQVRNGIVVLGKPVGITHRIIIQDCEVHDVEGDYRRNIGFFNMYKNSGIRVSASQTSSSEVGYDEVLIQRNFVHDVKTNGIYIVSEAKSGLTLHYTNVRVSNNTVIRTGADGAIISHCISPVIEYNQILDAGYHGNYLSTRVIAGLWGHRNTGEILFQFNEVARTKKFLGDGQAFDTDMGTGGTSIYQYNYTHENEGGFFLNCADLNQSPDYIKTILRYNVSVNDEQSIIWRDSATAVEVYNNVFYKTVGKLDPGNSDTYKYWNNIFNFSVKPNWGSCEYSNNCYFPIDKYSGDKNGISANPRFANEGWIGDGRKNADAYKVKADSPCIDKGMSIPNNGSKDFWGNVLYKELPDIGAMEFNE